MTAALALGFALIAAGVAAMRRATTDPGNAEVRTRGEASRKTEGGAR